MKKTLLTVLIVCMILSTVSVSAVTVTDNNYFSEYNVLYNRINSQQTMSTMSTNTTADSFDVVIGLDMSADMQAFDPSATYEWMEYFSVLPEQTGTNTRFAVVTNELSGEFSVDPSADIAAAASLGYIEVGSAQVLLENCVSAFESTTSATKVILLATADVSNVDLLESAAEQLAENGIYMFVYLLNPYAPETDCEYIYPCSSPLQLRLVLSDMYLSLVEYKTASSGSASTYAMTTGGNTGYISDYKADRHAMYDNTTKNGSRLLASVLNIYGCVPLYGAYGEKSYNLLKDIDTKNDIAVLEAFLNKDFSTTEFSVSDTSKFDCVWNGIAGNKGMFVTSNKLQVLEKNLKQRFPVIVIKKDDTNDDTNDDTYEIISEYTEGQYGETSFAAVFDTALYLAATSANAQTVSSSVSVYSTENERNFSEIEKTAPGENNTVSALLYGGGNSQSYTEGTYSMPGWVAKDGNTYTFTAENLTDDSAINHLVVAFKTIFENGLADCYDPDPYYLLRRYTDIPSSVGLWYYEYLSKATTLGIIRGNHENKFGVEADAEGEEAAYVTRAEFVKMAFSAAGIPQEVSTTGHWAENYMAEARKKRIIAEDIDSEAEYEEQLSRAEAAHIMNQLFLENADIVQVPTMLYRYDMDNIGQYDETKVSRWNNIVESEQPEEAYREDIFQMFMNDIMVGDGTGLHLAVFLNRAEAVALIMKPLFKLDDSFERVGTEYTEVYTPGKVLASELKASEQTYAIVIAKADSYKVKVAGEVTYKVTDINGVEQESTTDSLGNKIFSFHNNIYFVKVFGQTGKKFILLVGEPPQSELVFKPVEGGTFIYDNSPEYITNDDLADSNYGNKFLLSAENLSGIIDVQSSHSVKQYMLNEGEISFDVLLHNPTNHTIKVELLQLGVQAPYEEEDCNYNATSSQWACLKAWADYLQFDIIKENGIHDNLLYTEDFETKYDYLNLKYKSYECQNRIEELETGGKYEIGPGQSMWLLGDSRLTLRNKLWSPMNMVVRLYTKDYVDVSIAAFRDIAKVENPQKPSLIYTFSQRNYPENLAESEKEINVNRKYKGISHSLAEVETQTTWMITEETKSFSPHIYNYVHPDGYNTGQLGEIPYWVTNYNTNQDSSNFGNGTESEMIPLDFADGDNIWFFNTRRYIPELGNAKLNDPLTAPEDDAVIMGNYGVIIRYKIAVSNFTQEKKNISYLLGTQSHAIVRFKWNTENEWKVVLKGLTDYDKYNERHNMFNVNIESYEEDTLIFEVILPNGDNGGFWNALTIQ